jgi:hypothetical protein
VEGAQVVDQVRKVFLQQDTAFAVLRAEDDPAAGKLHCSATLGATLAPERACLDRLMPCDQLAQLV